MVVNRNQIHQAPDMGAAVADFVAAKVGSWPSAGIHAAWFVIWFVFHWDVNLLTNIVSLEAIFLAILLLISQNRQAAKDRKRDDLEAVEVHKLYTINQQQMEILTNQRIILAELRDKSQRRKWWQKGK